MLKSLSILFVVISTLVPFEIALASSLDPDKIEAHCEAFDGSWVRKCLERGLFGCQTWGAFSCKGRVEYQVKALKDQEVEFCQKRGGTWQEKMIKRRGSEKNIHVCVGAKTDVGSERILLTGEELGEAPAYQDVMQGCVKARDWSSAKCFVVDSAKAGGDFDYTDAPNTLLKAIYVPGDLINRSAKGVLPEILNPMSSQPRRLIHAALSHASQGLNSCQRACLTKCAASKILDYTYDDDGEPTMSKKGASLDNLYCTREGICSEFTLIANNVAKATRSKTATVVGKEHAFNSFIINGETLLGEPQSSSCYFFHSKNSLESYKLRLADDDTEYDGKWMEVLPERKVVEKNITPSPEGEKRIREH